MTRTRITSSLLSALFLATFNLSAQAQLFSDDEARKAIIELRNRVTQLEARQAELTQTTSRIDGMSRAQLDMVSTLETLRNELSIMRGALEQTAQRLKLSEDQQKELFTALDQQIQSLSNRLSGLEPQPFAIDGQTVMVLQTEKSAFQAAQSLLSSGAIEAGAAAFSEFNSRFPGSVLAPWALSFEGSGYYALKNYRLAIAALSRLSSDYPSHSRTANGLLTLAASQAESGQITAARATLSSIPKRFPGSEAARTATQRLKALPTAGAK